MKCQQCKNETASTDGICAQCEYEEKQREVDQALEQDDPFHDDDEEEDEGPDYWECYGCMRTYGRRPIGGMCDSCGSYVEEGHY